MDRVRIQEGAIRYGLLFLISVALVAGFWFHAEFYQLGLYPLLFIGGIATFLVLLALRTIWTGRLGWSKPEGTLPLPREAADRVLTGTQTVAILPGNVRPPPANAVASVVLAGTDRALTRVRIRDVRRVLASDVHADEARAAGFGDSERFRASWSGARRWDPDEFLHVVEFTREAHS